MQEAGDAVLAALPGILQGVTDALQWTADNKDLVIGALSGIVGVMGGIKVASGALEF